MELTLKFALKFLKGFDVRCSHLRFAREWERLERPHIRTRGGSTLVQRTFKPGAVPLRDRPCLELPALPPLAGPYANRITVGAQLFR